MIKLFKMSVSAILLISFLFSINPVYAAKTSVNSLYCPPGESLRKGGNEPLPTNSSTPAVYFVCSKGGEVTYDGPADRRYNINLSCPDDSSGAWYMNNAARTDKKKVHAFCAYFNDFGGTKVAPTVIEIIGEQFNTPVPTTATLPGEPTSTPAPDQPTSTPPPDSRPDIESENEEFDQGAIELIAQGLNCGYINGPCCDPKKNFRIRMPLGPLGEVPVLGAILRKVQQGMNAVLRFADKPLSLVPDFIYGPFLGIGPTEIPNTESCPSGGKAVRQGSACSCADEKTQNIAQLCLPIDNPEERQKCLECTNDGQGVWSGAGCLHTNLTTLVTKTLLGTFIGIAGGLTLLCIIYSALLFQTSRGDAERIKKAREYITNCIIGLILIIFSIFILRIIGVEILQIPTLAI